MLGQGWALRIVGLSGGPSILPNKYPKVWGGCVRCSRERKKALVSDMEGKVEELTQQVARLRALEQRNALLEVGCAFLARFLASSWTTSLWTS